MTVDVDLQREMPSVGRLTPDQPVLGSDDWVDQGSEESGHDLRIAPNLSADTRIRSTTTWCGWPN